MSRHALAQVLHVSGSLVAAWESGRQPPKFEYLTQLVKIFGFQMEDVLTWLEELMDGEGSPEWTDKWLAIEGAASMLFSYEHSVVPGLLQVPEYARTVIRQHSPLDYEDRTMRRIARKEIFDRDDPVTMIFVMDERALRNLVGNEKIMRDQLMSIIETCDRYPNVHVHIVPSSVGYHPGQAGAFMIAKVEGREIVYQDAGLYGQVLEQDTDVLGFTQSWISINDSMLNRKASRELIEKVAEEWSA